MHYVMTCEGPYPTRSLREHPNRYTLGDGSSWWYGRILSAKDFGPLVYTLDRRIYEETGKPGNPVAMYDEKDPPVMRGDLRRALEAAGVHNIQYYPAIVKDPLSGEELPDYFAFNVVGLVSAADMSKSKLMGTSSSTMLDADFDSLVIDESKAAAFPLFRLAENISAIVVSEQVRETVLAHGVPGMVFYPPGQWSG